MKNLNLLIVSIILIQSCETYRAVNIPEIQNGKTYEINLKNGQNLEAKCLKVTDKSISVIINENVIELPKSRISEAKRKKVSILNWQED